MVEKTCEKCQGKYDPDQPGGYTHVCPKPGKDLKKPGTETPGKGKERETAQNTDQKKKGK